MSYRRPQTREPSQSWNRQA